MSELLPPELEVRLDEAPSLAGRPRTVEYLTGGLTNINLKVTTPAGQFVARLSSQEGELLAIDREAEYRNSVAAAHTGVAPAVIDYVAGRGLLFRRSVVVVLLVPRRIAALARRLARGCGERRSARQHQRQCQRSDRNQVPSRQANPPPLSSH